MAEPMTAAELNLLEATLPQRKPNVTGEAVLRLIATARAGLADTERLDDMEEYLDSFVRQNGKLILEWFIGDGDPTHSSPITVGTTWREAIDAFVSKRNGERPPSAAVLPHKESVE